MNYSDTTLIALISGVIIPLLVGVVTKINASSGVKAIANAALSALAGALALVLPDGSDFVWRGFLVNFGLAWAISVSTYYGFWKPTGTSDTVQEATGNFGVG